MVGKIARDLAHGDLCRLIEREAVDARADGREIDRMTVVFARKAQAVAVAIGQQLRLTVLPVAPARTRRVDDVARRQAIAAGDLRLAGTAAVKTAALIEQTGPGGHVDGAVYPAAAEQRAVGGVDDGVDIRFRDVALNDLETVHAVTSLPSMVTTMRSFCASMATSPAALRCATTAEAMASSTSRWMVRRRLRAPYVSL